MAEHTDALPTHVRRSVYGDLVFGNPGHPNAGGWVELPVNVEPGFHEWFAGGLCLFTGDGWVKVPTIRVRLDGVPRDA